MTPAELPAPSVEPVKAKAKRAPRATKKAPVEEAPPAPAPTPEPVQEAPPQKAPVEKETCLDGGKSVASKTLKYNHRANCKALKAKDVPAPAKVAEPKNDVLNTLNLMRDVWQPVKDQLADTNNEELNNQALLRVWRLQKKMQRYATLTEHIC